MKNGIKIYAYISKNGGEIDLKKCSEELKMLVVILGGYSRICLNLRKRTGSRVSV